MKVLQLIDSLEPGGAERMAVNLANALSEKGHDSHLIATRRGGDLSDEILPLVQFSILNKKSAWDLAAVSKLIRYLRKHDITVLHAHSSSFFTAFLAKLRLGKLRLIWHDHYGLSEHLAQRDHRVLKMCSGMFDAIISVNDQLVNWAISNLRCRQVEQMNNFVWVNTNESGGIELKSPNTFRII